MKTATLIKEQTSGSGAHQGVYKLSEPLAGASIVVVSAVLAIPSGSETYIFAGDKNGTITGWTELEGSYRGGLSHTEALKGAGYTVVQ